MEARKIFVLSTAVIALFLFAGKVFVKQSEITLPVEVKVDHSFPSMGKEKAPVEIVLIEDFQCKKCREFSQKIIPKIQAEYVKTGKARFVLVPVSFLAGSQMMANSALEIYRQKPHLFFSFLKDVLAHEGDLRKEDLVRLARRIDGIDLDRFFTSIEKGAHNDQLQKNLDWARNLMGAHFRTPTLYINGAIGSTYSFEAIKYQVDQILEKQ